MIGVDACRIWALRHVGERRTDARRNDEMWRFFDESDIFSGVEWHACLCCVLSMLVYSPWVKKTRHHTNIFSPYLIMWKFWLALLHIQKYGTNVTNNYLFRRPTFKIQRDHLSGKPDNVRELYRCQGNVRNFTKSRGNVRELSGKNFVMEKLNFPL